MEFRFVILPPPKNTEVYPKKKLSNTEKEQISLKSQSIRNV